MEHVGRLLASGGATPSSLAEVTDVLIDQFGYEYVAVYLAEGDQLRLGAQRGYRSPVETLEVTSGVIGRVFRTHQAALVEDVQGDTDYVVGDALVVSEVAAPLLDGDRPLGVVSVESVRRRLDQTDLKSIVAVADRLATYLALSQERERLSQLSLRDALTGLHNRRFIDERIDRLFDERLRPSGATGRRPLSVVLFDLDNFGAFNKQYGHAVGDEVLERVSETIAAHFRTTDLIARYGGEEFLAVLDGASAFNARLRAEEVRAAIERETIKVGEDRIRITVSVGCATLEAWDESGWDRLRGAADAALGMAKRAGRNQVVSAAV